jgi:heterodisulfide reductase subunit C
VRGRPLALVLLGWSLFKTVLRRLFPGPRALAQFQAHYGSEGVLSVTRSEHELLTMSFVCTGCGRCDAGEASRIARTQKGYRGLMATVLGGTRSLVDFDAVSESISEVPAEALQAAEQACPEGVPIVRLVSLIRHHAERSIRARSTTSH